MDLTPRNDVATRVVIGTVLFYACVFTWSLDLTWFTFATGIVLTVAVIGLFGDTADRQSSYSDRQLPFRKKDDALKGK